MSYKYFAFGSQCNIYEGKIDTLTNTKVVLDTGIGKYTLYRSSFQDVFDTEEDAERFCRERLEERIKLLEKEVNDLKHVRCKTIRYKTIKPKIGE